MATTTEKEIQAAAGLGNADASQVMAGTTFSSESGFNQEGAFEPKAENITYDNTTSGLSGDTTQAAIDEVNENANDHINNKDNPHGVTKEQIGLGYVPNVETNNQTPTFTEARENTALTSGEKLSVAFGKIAKAISSLISHLANKSNPHGVTKEQIGLGNVDNTADANKSVNYAASAGSANSANYAASAGSATSANYAASAGSANSATKATQDGNGNNIVNTYATKNSLGSGGILNPYGIETIHDYGANYTLKFKYYDDPYNKCGVQMYAEMDDYNFYLEPSYDNITMLGWSTLRWQDIYSVSSTISTSDRNEKYDISYIGEKSKFDTETSDELLSSLIMGMNPVVFKRIGGKTGRPHHGMIAQDIEELLAKLGIDHAGFIKSPVTKKVEVYEVDGEEVLRKDLEGEFTKEIPKEILEEYGETVTKRVENEVIEGEYKYGLRYEEFIGDIIRFCQLLKNENYELRQEIQYIKDEIQSLKNI